MRVRSNLPQGTPIGRKIVGMTCPDCQKTAERLNDAIRALRAIGGSAAAARAPDPAKFLQDMARAALLRVEDIGAVPSMAPTERPQTRSSE